MKHLFKISWLIVLSIFALSLNSCDEDDPKPNPDPEPTINYSVFTDYALGAYLEYQDVPTVMSTDSGFIYVADSLASTTELNLSKASASIEDLTNDGVMYADVKIAAFPELSHFTGLTHLTLTSNELTELDLSHNTALKVLQMNFNQVNSLDLSALTQLDSLRYKGDKDNVEYRLSSIDLSNNTALTHLYLPRHNLNNIDLTGLDNLTYIDLTDNPGEPFVVSDALYAQLTVANGVIDETTASQTIFKHVVIPDTVFAQEIIANAEVPCVIKEGDVYYLDTVKAKETTRLDVSVSSSAEIDEAIADFTGIEYFINLTYFKFNYSVATSLDLTKNTAIDSVHHTALSASNDQQRIASITFADNSKIKYIQLFRNALTEFDASTFTGLTYLNLRDGLITTGNLVISETANTALERVRVNGNTDDPLIISAAAYNMLKANSYYSVQTDPDAALDADGLASGN